MAIQGKGIIGNPSGKIGSIHFYKRRSKTIVQSISRPADKWLRRWNLLKWQLTQRLEAYWLSMDSGGQSKWDIAAPPSQTGQEYFISFNLGRTILNRYVNLSGGRFRVAGNNKDVELSAQGNWDERQIIVNISELDQYWSDPGTVQLNMRYYTETGGLQVQIINYGAIGFQPLVVDMPASLAATVLHAVVWPQKVSPNVSYNMMLSDIFNPSTIF